MGTIVTIRQDQFAAAGLGRSNRGPSLLQTLVASVLWIEAKVHRHRSRQILLELTDYQLKDIGLSRCDAVREAGRRFWD